MSVAPAAAPARGGARVLALLRAPGARSLVVLGLVARLPLGMFSLATVLLLRGEGRSYAQAGLTLAAYTLASAATSPVLGRLIDRLGVRAVLVPLAATSAASTLALLLLARGGAPAAVLGLAGAVAGATLPPISACVRAIWPDLLPHDDLREAAFALEATSQEIFYVAGSPLVVALAALGSPDLAMVAVAVIGGAGTLAFAGTVGARGRTGSGVAPGGGALRALSPGIRTIAVTGLAMGGAFGCFEVAMPAFAEHHGNRSAGGWALAAFSLGSLAGGLLVSSLPPPRSRSRRLLVSLALFAAAIALPLAAGSIPALIGLTLAAGLPIAPTFASAYGLVDALAPPDAMTEAFAWISTSIVAGVSGGTALAGVLVSHAGVRAALVLAVAVAALGAGVVAARRATLQQAGTSPTPR